MANFGKKVRKFPQIMPEQAPVFVPAEPVKMPEPEKVPVPA